MSIGLINLKGILRLALKIVVASSAAIFIAFVSIDNLPGDSATILSGTLGNDKNLRVSLGLDVPILQRFINWFSQVLSGDLGTSTMFDMPVVDIIVERILITMPLAISAFCVATIFGIGFGTLSVLKIDTAWYKIINSFIVLFLSVPVVWSGLFFISLFSVTLGWLPSSGYEGYASYILPSLVLGLGQGAITARYVHTALIGVKDKDFIHFARLRGYSKTNAYIKHGLPAVAGSLLAILGLQVGFLMTGVVVVERIFSMPGLGDLLYQAMLMRDIPVASATIGFLVLMIICVNTVVDIVAYLITPALRKGYHD